MKKRTRNILAAAAIVLVLCVTIVGTTAYLNGKFGLNNTFALGTVVPEVVESFDGKVKKDVAIQNSGNTPIYVRCRVTIYNEQDDGSISNQIPARGMDYTMTYPASLQTDWFLIDGIYYYKAPLPAGAKTSNLIDHCELKHTGIVVDISAQSIQATPADAVQDAWKVVEVDGNGNLKQVAAPIAP